MSLLFQHPFAALWYLDVKQVLKPEMKNVQMKRALWEEEQEETLSRTCSASFTTFLFEAEAEC